MKRVLAFVSGLLIVAAILLGAWGTHFANSPLPLPPSKATFEFTVRPGATLKTVSRQLAEAGLLPDAQSLWLLGRVTQLTGIQAGTYRLDKSPTPLELLRKMVDGDVVPVTVTFVEGITFAEMRRQLESTAGVKVTLAGMSNTEVLKRIGANETHPEGLFFPDTYQFAAGISDLELLRKSYQAMQKKLANAWAKRDADLPYKNAYEALIMASIIEKETGRADERPLIGSVFVNRLRIPMRLQTDPTVIYGMGQNYDGNIRKRDLSTDTPYNTYTRDGLPPTPIAMPGAGSLLGALNPAKSDKLYFVAKGDGSHYFSRSLDEHNRAVAKFQLRQ
jgi:UPF0755 protein